MRPSKGKRILVVDDDEPVRTLLHHVLVAAGYGVDSVATAAAALKLIDERRYHLVLADDQLPDGRGVEIADKAQSRGIDAVVVTGYALRTAKEELARHEVLLKPLSPDELVAAVDRHLDATC